MKVLLVVHGLPIGGTEIMVCKLARYLRSRQVDVELGCLDELGELGEGLAEEGFPTTVYNRKEGWDTRLPLRIARHVRRGRFDVVHAHQFTCYFYAALAKLLSRTPLIFTEHGRFYPDVASRKRQWANRFLQRLVDRTTAVSEGVKNSLVHIEKFSPGRIRVVYNGIEIEPEAPLAAVDRSALRCSLHVPPDASVVGTVGRLDPIKNQALLIRAFARLRREHDKAYLLIVGAGPEREKLERHAAELGQGDRVRFLGPRRDIARILQAFDVFALSSVSEGLPMTILETMASGVPIVSTAVGGITEILATGRNALLVPTPESLNGDVEQMLQPSFVEEYAGALRMVLENRELASRLTAAASAGVRERFSLPVIGEQYLDIYGEVTALKGKNLEMMNDERTKNDERQTKF